MKEHFEELLKLQNVRSLEGPRYWGTSWSKKVIQASDEDAFETPPLRGVLVRPLWTKAEGIDLSVTGGIVHPGSSGSVCGSPRMSRPS